MSKKILIVDDDVDLADAMRTLLESKGHRVLYAQDGVEGLSLAREENPDLMFLDVMMTRQTEGFEVARSLKENANTRDLPVVLVTGIRREMNLPFGFGPDEDWLPVKQVLEKPVKPEALLDAVRQHAR